MLTFKILATVAVFGLNVYYVKRLMRFYGEAADHIGRLNLGLDEKMEIYRKFVSFKAPLLDTVVSFANMSLLVFWIFG